MSGTSLKNGGSTTQRWVMPALVLLFVGPLVAAGFFYFFADGWRPASTVNHGRLLDPPVTLSDATLPAAGGATTPADFLRGRWTLVYISDDGCDAVCGAALDKTRRVRLALREKAARVQRILLAREPLPVAGFAAEEQPDVLTAHLAGGAGAALFRQFAGTLDDGSQATGRVFVVDPLGNVMMVYEPGFEMKGMLADLKRLLKLSRIG